MNIAETVKAAQNGDKKAVEELYKNYIAEIKTLAKCYFPNEDDAEDAASEIFLLVMQKIGSVKNPAAFNGWLKRVIENKCVSMLRKKREFTMDDEDYIDNECNTDTENCPQVVPHEKLDNDETQKIIYHIVSELPEKYKSVILMYYYSDMSVESIAKALAISEGTVKSRLNYARDKIGKKIKAYEKQGIKLYNIDILKSLGQIISNISQNTQVTTQFSTVINSLANSSSTFTSAVSTITTTQVSNIVSTSVARTISNATATRISVVASAVVVAACTAVTQLPPTDAQITPEIQTSTVYEVEHEISIQEVPVIQESIVYVTSEVVSTVYDTSVMETTVTETNTIHDTSTVYDTSIIHDVSTVYDTSIIENTITEISTVYVEKPPKDYSVYHYEEDDMFRYKVYDNANEAEIVKVKAVPENMEETWILPDTFNDIPVTKIGREVFAWKNIPSVPENIKIGENVEEIGRGAFMDCNSLKNIELNDKITKIAPKTFYNCQNLETVTGGKNVETVEEYAFEGTSSMKSVDLGSLKTIEDSAFEGCTIEEIVFSDSIEYIGDFSYPTADTVTVYVNTEKAEKEPDIYKQMGDILCNAKTVNIIFTGNAVKYSGARYNLMEELFDWSIGDEQILNISFEDSIEEIDNGAFYDCNTLKEITLPKNLRSVGIMCSDNALHLKKLL